jgi:hypothetical protein
LVTPAAGRVLLIAPPVGCVVFALVAVLDEGMFRALVREDSVIEWAEVIAYACAFVFSVRIVRERSGVVAVAYALVACAAILAIGEELSWGQRLFGLGTPEPLAASNRQGELNVHNMVDAESPTRLALLVASTYALAASFVRRPGPFVPPRVLASAFGVVAAYFAVRFAFIPEPTYVQAKFSEWPELCFAVAVALTAWSVLSAGRRGGAASWRNEASLPQSRFGRARARVQPRRHRQRRPHDVDGGPSRVRR